MSFIPRYKKSHQNRSYRFAFNDFDGGVHLGGSKSDGSVSYISNMVFENGKAVKRKGQSNIFNTSYGAILGMCSFDGKLIAKIGSSLYCAAPASGEPELLGNIGNGEVLMFRFGARLYIICDGSYYYYDGASLSTVSPYIPTIRIGTHRDGTGGNVYESFNLIGRGFCEKFCFDGNGEYSLSQNDLASDEISVILNGADISASCTFDRANGKITVSGHGGVGETGINNLSVTAYLKESAVADGKSKILSCTCVECFGGTDGKGTRIFLSGNSDYPNHLFRSALLDPTYFPDTDFELVGNSGDGITALCKQYGELMVLCKNSVYAVSYIYNDGDAVFSCRTVNSDIGCDMRRSVQLIGNRTVFANSKKGIFIICAGSSEDENNIVSIGANIYKSSKGYYALSDSELFNCYSIDYDNKYWLFLENKCYIWDYGIRNFYGTGNSVSEEQKLTWFIFTGINAVFPTVYNKYLYYGTESDHLAVYGIAEDDFGIPITASIITSPCGLGFPNKLKKLLRTDIYYSTSGNTYCHCKTVCDDDLTSALECTFTLTESEGFTPASHHRSVGMSCAKAYRYFFEFTFGGSGKTQLDRIDISFLI